MLRTLSALLIALLTSARADIPFHAGAGKQTEPSAPAKSTEKIVEEINTDLGKVVDQLTKSDPGAATRAGQDRILENIDRLLKQHDPSPPKSGSQNPPSNSPPPSSKQPNPKPSAADPMNQPKPQPLPPDAKPKQQTGSEQQSQKPNSLEELKKEMKDEKWPPFPPRLRQEMDSASRAQFIRNYEELLRAYYRNLAESSRRTHAD